MPIGQNLFRGFVPRLPAHLQPENGAHLAVNCNFAHGELRGFPADETVVGYAPLTSTKAIFTHLRKDGDFRVFNFDQDTFCVSSPNAEDTHARYYYSPGNTGGVYVFSAKDVATYQNKVVNNPAGKKAGLPQIDVSGISVSAISSAANRTSVEGLAFEWHSFWEVDGKVTQEKEFTPTLMPGDTDFFNDAGNMQGRFTLAPQDTGYTYQPQQVKIREFTMDGVTHKATDYGSTIQLTTAADGVTKLATLNVVSATGVQLLLANGTFGATYEVMETDTLMTESGVVEPVQEFVRRTWLLQGKGGDLPVAAVKLTAKDESGVEVFTLYSNGSAQVTHSNTSIIPGGVSMTLKHVSGAKDTYQFEVRFSNYETRSYAFTLVNIYGEESAPTRTKDIDLNYFQDARLVGTNVSLAGYADYAPMAGVRIYRSADLGNGSAEFLLLFDSTKDAASPGGTHGLISASVTSSSFSFEYIDHKKTEDLGMALFTDANWLPPPDGVKALCVMRNGIMCAYKESTVYFAHAYRPYAWDRTKSITFPQSVRALMPFSNGLLVFTSGPLFFVAGQTADALSYQQMQGAHGLILNEHAWVETDKGAMFATDDGLCVTDGNTVSTEMSLQLLTRSDWQRLFKNVTTKLRLAWWDGKLLIYATNTKIGYLVDFDEAGGQLTQLLDFQPVSCHSRWPVPDKLLLVEAGIPRYSVLFEHATLMRPLEYRSRLYELPFPVCFASLQVRQEGTSTISIYRDSSPADATPSPAPFVLTCTGDSILRLPSGFRARKWWYKIERDANQTGAVRALHLALSANELKGV